MDRVTPTPPGTAVSVCPLDSAGFTRRVDDLIAVHLAAMDYPTAYFDERRSLWLTNARQHQFTCEVAVAHPESADPDPAERTQRIVGVAFAFRGHRATWWYREVHRGLTAGGHSPRDAGALLRDYSEISEVHVHPRAQGLGIGRVMLTRLLERLTTPVALLSTPEVPDEANAAWHLYRRLGFTDVLRDFHFAGDDRGFGVLGVVTPAGRRLRDRTRR
ncbi:GNAT family N-acetyltransferase [Corynebacterium bovis]|uniref:GNAT family N-acetyltransferase n=1 Tax=Corynebacterium bovis TaxID=36808 RepID=UPI0021AB543C|nr:N-acetyltransferase [Corynebacterium bovis]MDN8580052.1 N-acetyltransferase [Corynebacterium bovis]